jgi:CRP-like cAMP-binding protein
MVLQNSTVMAITVPTIPLAQNRLLLDLDPPEIDGVLALGERKSVVRREALFKKDAPSDGVWLIEEGTVSILSGRNDSARLATLGPGQFVGEMGVIDGKTRSATAMADSPVRALLLDKAAIAELMESQPAVGLKLIRTIARELSYRVRASSAVLVDDGAVTHPDWTNSTLGPASRF